MKISLTASIVSCLGKSNNISEAIENLEDVMFISKDVNMKESQRIFNMVLTNDLELNQTRNSLNYLIAKFRLKESVITITH